MGKYSNVTKISGESKIGGAKYRMLFTYLSLLSACPQPDDTKTIDEDYRLLTGEFVFADEADAFNALEFVSTTGMLEWESIGAPGSMKSKISFKAFFNTMQASFYRFIEEGRNDDLVMIVERADCSGDRFVFGGCCLPAQMTKYKGGLGDKPESDVGTTVEFEAYANGLPMMLPAETVLAVEPDPADFNDDFSHDTLI